MVHALREAHRVLKPNGLLLDLRPGPTNRRAGLLRGRRWQAVAAMRERFDDDRAANRAVARVLREGSFKQERELSFDLKRHMDTLEDLRAWVNEFVQVAELAPHDWLVERVAQAHARAEGSARIVVRGPLQLKVLRKVS